MISLNQFHKKTNRNKYNEPTVVSHTERNFMKVVNAIKKLGVMEWEVKRVGTSRVAVKGLDTASKQKLIKNLTSKYPSMLIQDRGTHLSIHIGGDLTLKKPTKMTRDTTMEKKLLSACYRWKTGDKKKILSINTREDVLFPKMDLPIR